MYIGLLGVPFGAPWVSLGSLWDAIGLFLAVLGAAFAPFGVPWGALGLPLVALGGPCGCFPEILETGDLVSYEVTRIAVRSAFLELAAGAAGATGATEMVSKMVARTPPPTRAGGQDDGSYTNSLKLILYIPINPYN